eukprot:symbB.v1.2.028992.t2/scaffold3111.1/size63350/7
MKSHSRYWAVLLWWNLCGIFCCSRGLQDLWWGSSACELSRPSHALAVLDANFQQEKELGHSATLSDKVKLVLRTVDPERISVAVGCIWAGCMGIVMALKYKFARTVAFAHSIGDNLRPLAAKVLAPSALAVTPPEYRQWVEPTINVGCKVVATMVAWKLQRTISSVQSGIAGGMIASRSACSYILPILKNRNLVPDMTEDSLLDELLGWGLAATGIYFQATPPLIFLPVTLPIGIAESWLKWSAKYSAKRHGKENKAEEDKSERFLTNEHGQPECEHNMEEVTIPVPGQDQESVPEPAEVMNEGNIGAKADGGDSSPEILFSQPETAQDESNGKTEPMSPVQTENVIKAAAKVVATANVTALPHVLDLQESKPALGAKVKNSLKGARRSAKPPDWMPTLRPK